jgi:hypothetical protein
LRLLQRSADVDTRYGGGFVGSIEGRSGGRQDGRPVDWFFYVNGVESDSAERECDEVAERLDRAGVEGTSRSALSQREEGGVLRVLVGQWKELRLDPTALRLQEGPAETGIYARPDATGRRIDVLDARGRVARTLGPGAGLVAATQQGEARPVWFVTGTDEVGLAAAAAALEEDVLRDRFAITIEDGRVAPVPAPQ